MTFALSGFMLYTMWVVLGLIGITFFVDMYRGLRGNTFSLPSLSDFLQDILYYVFPLFILANLTLIDPTEWLVSIFYYIGAIGVIFKYLLDIQRKL